MPYTLRAFVFLTLLHGLLGLRQALLEEHVGGLELQSSLVNVVGLGVAAETEEGSSLAAVALGPVGFELDSLLTILKGLQVVLLGGVAGRAVGVEDVVGSVDLNGL